MPWQIRDSGSCIGAQPLLTRVGRTFKPAPEKVFLLIDKHIAGHQRVIVRYVIEEVCCRSMADLTSLCLLFFSFGRTIVFICSCQYFFGGTKKIRVGLIIIYNSALPSRQGLSRIFHESSAPIFYASLFRGKDRREHSRSSYHTGLFFFYSTTLLFLTTSPGFMPKTVR